MGRMHSAHILIYCLKQKNMPIFKPFKGVRPHKDYIDCFPTHPIDNFTQEEINQKVEEINTKNNNGKVELYQDDGENFWSLKSSEKLDIGTKEDNYKKWDELKSRALPIEVEDLLVFCSSNETKLKSNYKLK